RLVVAGAGAVDDQRADVIPVGQVLQSSEGLQGEIAQLVPIAGAPVHDAVARGAVQVVISGVTSAHALGFDGGMKARPGRLPEQLGVGAVAGNAGKAATIVAGIVCIFVAVITGVERVIGQISTEVNDKVHH